MLLLSFFPTLVLFSYHHTLDNLIGNAVQLKRFHSNRISSGLAMVQPRMTNPQSSDDSLLPPNRSVRPRGSRWFDSTKFHVPLTMKLCFPRVNQCLLGYSWLLYPKQELPGYTVLPSNLSWPSCRRRVPQCTGNCPENCRSCSLQIQLHLSDPRMFFCVP